MRKAKAESSSIRVRSKGKHIKNTTSLLGNISWPKGGRDVIRSTTTEIRSVLKIEGEKLYRGFGAATRPRTNLVSVNSVSFSAVSFCLSIRKWKRPIPIGRNEGRNVKGALFPSNLPHCICIKRSERNSLIKINNSWPGRKLRGS